MAENYVLTFASRFGWERYRTRSQSAEVNKWGTQDFVMTDPLTSRCVVDSPSSPSIVSSLNVFLSLSWWELSVLGETEHVALTLTLISPHSVLIYSPLCLPPLLLRRRIVVLMWTLNAARHSLSQVDSEETIVFCPGYSEHFLSSSVSLSSSRCSTNDLLTNGKNQRTNWDKSQSPGSRQWAAAWNVALFNRLIAFHSRLVCQQEWTDAGWHPVHIIVLFLFSVTV